MSDITLRPATEADIPALVALNAAVVDVTSPMDAARCAELIAASTSCLVAVNAGEVVGFALVMTEGDPYDGENFGWFGTRLKRFVYVDRIVIGAQARGRGLGTRFYAQIEDDARAAGCLMFAAEMNLVPPNATSLGFHAARGFVQIGTRHYPDGKVLAMQVKGLT